MSIAHMIANRPATDIVSCDGDTTVRAAIALLAEQRIGALPVEESGRLIGIFSERDVIYGLANAGEAMLRKPVKEVMTAPAITVSPDTDVMAALALMTRRRIRHLPVTEAGRTIAFISIGDLVKFRIERIEAEAEAMRSYIQTG
ncbi:MAG: hypothetical protein RLZZ136_1575 [Pseudomonadota bacterium]|jgi:CBS domain-containing protein